MAYKGRTMFTEIESIVEQSESTTPGDPPVAMDAAHETIGMEFDPHHLHGTTVEGEAKTEGSAAGCPYAQFFSGIFGSEES